MGYIDKFVFKMIFDYEADTAKKKVRQYELTFIT